MFFYILYYIYIYILVYNFFKYVRVGDSEMAGGCYEVVPEPRSFLNRFRYNFTDTRLRGRDVRKLKEHGESGQVKWCNKRASLLHNVVNIDQMQPWGKLDMFLLSPENRKPLDDLHANKVSGEEWGEKEKQVGWIQGAMYWLPWVTVVTCYIIKCHMLVDFADFVTTTFPLNSCMMLHGHSLSWIIQICHTLHTNRHLSNSQNGLTFELCRKVCF